MSPSQPPMGDLPSPEKTTQPPEPVPLTVDMKKEAVADVVRRLFEAKAPNQNRLKVVRKETTASAVMGSSGSQVEEVLAIVNRCEREAPRWIDCFYDIITNPDTPPIKEGPIQLKESGKEFSIQSAKAAQLMIAMFEGAAKSLGDRPKEFAGMMLTAEESLRYFLKLSPEEKTLALRSLKIKEERIPLLAGRLDTLIGYDVKTGSAAAEVVKGLDRLKAEREAAGVAPAASADYWKDRVDGLNTREYVPENLFAEIDPRRTIDVMREIDADIKNFNQEETYILARYTGMAMKRMLASVAVTHNTLMDIRDELGLDKARIAAAERIYKDASEVAGCGDAEFAEKVVPLFHDSNEFMRVLNRNNDWGTGIPQFQMIWYQQALLGRPELFRQRSTRKEEERMAAGIRGMLDNLSGFYVRELPFFKGMADYAKFLQEIDGADHGLARSCFRAVFPPGGGSTSIGGTILLVDSDYSNSLPKERRDYQRRMTGLIRDNAAHPSIRAFVESVTDIVMPENLDILDAVISQEHLDWARRIGPKPAEGALKAFRVSRAQRYVCSATPEGKAVMAQAESSPGVLTPLSDLTDSKQDEDFAIRYLELLSKPAAGKALADVSGKAYQGDYARTAVAGDSGLRSDMADPKFTGFLERMESANPGGAAKYLRLVSESQGRKHLVSDAAQALLLEDPSNADRLATIARNKRLNEVLPAMAKAGNREFFRPEVLGRMAEWSASNRKWAVAQAALAELEAWG
jgi:hypothetical protein